MKIALVPLRAGKDGLIYGADITILPDTEDEYPELIKLIEDAKRNDFIKVSSSVVSVEATGRNMSVDY